MNAFVRFLVIASLTTGAFGQDKITYADHVRAVFESKCFSCHNTDKKKGGLDLSTFTTTMEGGSGGAVVEAGNAAGSRLFQSITKQAEPFMPPKGEQVPNDQLAVIEKWIAGGLLETNSSVAIKPKKLMVDLVVSDALGKPDGPPPMPEHLLLEPVTQSERATMVWSIAASPWAPLIAVSGQHQILLYHSDTLELNGIISYADGVPHDLHFSENGKLILAAGGRGGKSGKVQVFEVATGRQVMELGAEFDAVLGADISADQAFVALGGASKAVKMYATSNGEIFKEIKKHTEWVTAVDYSPDGVLLATADRNGDVFVWETFSGNEFYKLGGHGQKVTGLSWRADSNVLTTVSEDGQVKLWEMNNGSEVKSWGAHGGVLSVDFAKDGRLITGGRDGKAVIWSADGKALATLQGFTDIVTEVEFSHNDERVFVSDWNGIIKVFDAKDGKELGALQANPPTIAARIATLQSRAEELALQHLSAAAQFHRTLAPFEAATFAFEDVRKRLQEGSQRLQQLKSASESLTKTNTDAQAALQLASADLKTVELEAAALGRTIETCGVERQRLQALGTRMKLCLDSKAALDSAVAVLDPAADDADVLAAKEQSAAALASINRAIETLTPGVSNMEQLLAEQQATIDTTQPLLEQCRKSLAERQSTFTKQQEAATHAAAEWQKNTAATTESQVLVDQLNLDLPSRQSAYDMALKAHTEARQGADSVLSELKANEQSRMRLEAAKFNVSVIAQRRQLEERQAELLGLRDGIAQLESAQREVIAGAGAGDSNSQRMAELAHEQSELQSKADAVSASVEELKLVLEQGHQQYLAMVRE